MANPQVTTTPVSTAFSSTNAATATSTATNWTAQSLTGPSVSSQNASSGGMGVTNIVQSNLTRKVPFSNYSIQFDAAGGDYARTTAGSNSILSGSTSFTISSWVNFADTSSLRPIVTNWSAGSTSYNYIFRYHNSQLQLYVHANGSTGNAFYGFTPTLNTWYHVLGTWENGTIKIYLNGLAVGTPGTRSGTMPTITTSDNIGLYTASGTNYFMDGKLSNIAYWKNSALSEGDILNIYNNGITQDLSNFTITPTSWFPMDESYTYFNGTSLIFRNGVVDRDVTGFNIVQENIIGNAPGSEANGTGSNLTIADLEGNMYNSNKNAYSINMADYASGVTNPANSGRSTDTP